MNFNSPGNSDLDTTMEEYTQMELSELRRQILFLQGQLEDKEEIVQSLREQTIKFTSLNYHDSSAPATIISPKNQMCNAATQTERVS